MSHQDAFRTDLHAYQALAQSAAELPGFDGRPDAALADQLELLLGERPGLEERLTRARWLLRRRLIAISEALEATAMARLRRLNDEHAAWWQGPPCSLVLPGGDVVPEPYQQLGPEVSFAAMWPGELTRALALYGEAIGLAARIVDDLAGQVWAVMQAGVFATGRVGLGNLHQQLSSLMILPTCHLARKAPDVLRDLIETVEYHLYHEVTALLDDVSSRLFPVLARVLGDLCDARSRLRGLAAAGSLSPSPVEPPWA